MHNIIICRNTKMIYGSDEALSSDFLEPLYNVKKIMNNEEMLQMTLEKLTNSRLYRVNK